MRKLYNAHQKSQQFFRHHPIPTRTLDGETVTILAARDILRRNPDLRFAVFAQDCTLIAALRSVRRIDIARDVILEADLRGVRI